LLILFFYDGSIGLYYKKWKFNDWPVVKNFEIEIWQIETATKYGILSTINQRGKPRKDA
jgi:hypothetical protein